MKRSDLAWLLAGLLLVLAAGAACVAVPKSRQDAGGPSVTATAEGRQDAGDPSATATAEGRQDAGGPSATATAEGRQDAGGPSAMPACGLFYVQAGDAPTVDQVGATLAHLIVRPAQGIDSWREQIGALAGAGAQVILEMYPRPWTWDGSRWVFDAGAQPFLDLAAERHAAGQVLAVFGPVDEPYAHGWTTAQLQALYRELKARAPDLPIYSTFGSLAFWESHDPARIIAPGVADYASPHYYPFDASGYQREAYIAALEAEIDILNRRAPDTRLIWLVQVFALPTHPRGLRMPTGDELRDASQIALDRGVPILYYPYQRVAASYTDWLAQHPELLDSVCPQ